MLGVTNLIPGPNSIELALHIGYDRGGWHGLIIAGSCFILPAMLIVWMLATIYVRYQQLPELKWVLYGIKPVIIAIVAQALWQLGKKALKDIPTMMVGVAVITAFFLDVNEIFLLLVAGLVVMLSKNFNGTVGALLLPISGVLAVASSPMIPPATWLNVFCFLSKLVLFYMVVAMCCLHSCNEIWWNATDGLHLSNS